MDAVKLQKMRFTGTLVHYMAICPRKAWLFAKGIAQEQNSTLVEIGKWISETSYPDKRHEIEIDRTIVLDWIDWKNKVIHEVKKSSKMEDAHRLQVQYYIYYLEQSNHRNRSESERVGTVPITNFAGCKQLWSMGI